MKWANLKPQVRFGPELAESINDTPDFKKMTKTKMEVEKTRKT